MSPDVIPEAKLVAFAIQHADRDTPRHPKKGRLPGKRAARKAFAHDIGTGRIALEPNQLRAAKLVHRSAYDARVKIIEREEQTLREKRHELRTGRAWVPTSR